MAPPHPFVFVLWKIYLHKNKSEFNILQCATVEAAVNKWPGRMQIYRKHWLGRLVFFRNNSYFGNISIYFLWFELAHYIGLVAYYSNFEQTINHYVINKHTDEFNENILRSSAYVRLGWVEYRYWFSIELAWRVRWGGVR